MGYYYKKFPRSRIATFDVFAVGLDKHHVIALLEFDVTDSRRKLKELRKNGSHVSFTAWIIKVIGVVLQQHKEATAYLRNRRKLIIFNDINVSILIEKRIAVNKVPIPLVIEKTNEKSAGAITLEIENAKSLKMSGSEIVLNRKTSFFENVYYMLPGSLRRSFWRFLLRNPKFAYRKMGNVVVTSVGMMGTIKGWFIHRSVHPISFGIGSIIKKPVVVNDAVTIREILNMTVLVDHDVLDGAPMVRFLNDLTRCIEGGEGMET